MTEYADPDLETIAPLPPGPPPGFGPPASSPPPGRGPIVGLVTAMIVVSLVVGFGTATLVLDARDKGSSPLTIAPNPSPTSPTLPPSGPTTTAPSRPPDPNENVLGDLILRQTDVPATYVVQLLDQGTDLSVPTLDLCNGTFPSEANRTARRQVALSDTQGLLHMSTEAVLYQRAAQGVQAFAELQSVAAHCPSTPVTSPVGEGVATTKINRAPDTTWPKVPSVDRLAYDFSEVDPTTGDRSHSVAVYLRRGRALVGVYFPQPTGAQTAVEGRTTMAGIVAVFEARLAAAPAAAIGG